MTSTLTQPERTGTAKPGSARAALGYRDFRIIWIGLFASGIGTWMQNVALPAYVDERTHRAAWVALMGFALLGPLLILSIPGGVLADRLPRREWLMFNQGLQLCLAFTMALLIARGASLWAMFVVQLFSGISNALSAPAMQASIPMLVSREDLPGALSLNSVMLNGARVIGPVMAAAMMAAGVTVSQIFMFNGLTYLFALGAIAVVTLPRNRSKSTEKGLQTLLTGLRIARNRGVLSRILITLSLFSLLCLPYIGLFPSIARLSFHINGGTSTYKWLYATWGFGAMLGGLSCGTIFTRIDRRRLIVIGLRGFAAAMLGFTLARSATAAIPIGFLLGFFYFLAVTPMSIIFQQNLRDHERARVMSLWFVAFGGMVTIGGLCFGPIVDAFGPRPVLAVSVVAALALSRWTDLIRRPAGLLVDEPDNAVSGEALQSPEMPEGL